MLKRALLSGIDEKGASLQGQREERSHIRGSLARDSELRLVSGKDKDNFVSKKTGLTVERNLSGCHMVIDGKVYLVQGCTKFNRSHISCVSKTGFRATPCIQRGKAMKTDLPSPFGLFKVTLPSLTSISTIVARPSCFSLPLRGRQRITTRTASDPFDAMIR